LLNSISVDDVSVNPETKRHVRIELKVKDSTTANIAVTIPQTVGELDVNTPKEDVGNDVFNSGRSTSDEHFVNVLTEWMK
jgi:hypothetical protein